MSEARARVIEIYVDIFPVCRIDPPHRLRRHSHHTGRLCLFMSCRSLQRWLDVSNCIWQLFGNSGKHKKYSTHNITTIRFFLPAGDGQSQRSFPLTHHIINGGRFRSLRAQLWLVGKPSVSSGRFQYSSPPVALTKLFEKMCTRRR